MPRTTRHDDGGAVAREYLDALAAYRDLAREHVACGCTRCIAAQDALAEATERARTFPREHVPSLNPAFCFACGALWPCSSAGR